MIIMEALPDEILVEIFKRLDGATLLLDLPLVSKRFNRLAKTAITPRPFGFTINDQDGLVRGTVDSVMDSLNQDKNMHIKELYMNKVNSVADFKNTLSILKSQPGLQLLCLGGRFGKRDNNLDPSWYDRKLKTLLSSMRHLQVVSVTGLHHDVPTYYGTTRYPEVMSNCSPFWTRRDLMALLKSNTRLKRLHLPSVSPSTFNFLLVHPDPSLTAWRQRTESLCIQGLDRKWIDEPEIKWDNLVDFPNLTRLVAGEGDHWLLEDVDDAGDAEGLEVGIGPDQARA